MAGFREERLGTSRLRPSGVRQGKADEAGSGAGDASEVGLGDRAELGPVSRDLAEQGTADTDRSNCHEVACRVMTRLDMTWT